MRATLQDLIRSGALPVGSRLYHPNRTRPDTAVTATITAEGLKLGNRVFSSPSKAAEAVAKYAVNGWYFWRFKETGKPLQSIRPWREP